MHTIAFKSKKLTPCVTKKKLTPAEINYPVHDKKCLPLSIV